MSNTKMLIEDRNKLMDMLNSECLHADGSFDYTILTRLVMEGQELSKARSPLKYAAFVLFKRAMVKDNYSFMDKLYTYLNDDHLDTMVMRWARSRIAFETEHCAKVKLPCMLNRYNFNQFKNPIKLGNPDYIELEVMLAKLSWRLQAITELEDAGLSDTERCSCLKEEVIGLFYWANDMLATCGSTKE